MFAAQIRIEAECRIYICDLLGNEEVFCKWCSEGRECVTRNHTLVFRLEAVGIIAMLDFEDLTEGILLSTTQNKQEELKASAGILLQTSWPAGKKKQNLFT